MTTEITSGDTVVKAGHQAEKVEAKPATETEAGNIEYWYCAACGKYFKDEALTQEITLEDTVISALGASSQQTPSQGQQMDSPQTGDSSNTNVGLLLLYWQQVLWQSLFFLQERKS